MAGHYDPPEEVSDYSEDEDDGGLPENIDLFGPLAFHFGMDDEGSDDGFLIDEWVDEMEEEGWTTCDTDDSDTDVMYTDGLPVKKIFVTNFQVESTSHELHTLFSKFGPVTDVSILDGKSNRYAFITFENPEHAYFALRATPNELQLRWRKLRVFPAHSWHQPRATPTEKWQRDVSVAEGECFINKLNDDCLLYVFKFLAIKEQLKIERVCKRWQGLSQSMWLRRTEFDLSNLSDKYSRFCVPAFRKVLRYCGEHLTALDFCNVKSDSLSAVLPLITKNCSNLEVLKISEVPLNRCALHNLSAKCRNLRHITFRSCQGLKDSELGKMIHRLEKLEYLDISKNTSIQGLFIKFLKPSVTSLVLDECNNLIMKNIVHEMGKTEWNVSMLSLNACQTLTTLDVQQLCTAAAGKLRHLRLNHYYPRLHPKSLRVLGSLTELTSLSLKFNSSVKKDVILNICKGCLKLEDLDISGCVERDQLPKEIDTALEAVARLPQLQRLKISYMMFTDIALNSLAKYTRSLKLLECQGCPSVTNQGVSSVLAQCVRLEHFDLSGCHIQPKVLDDAVLAVTTRKEKIKLCLYLGGTRVMKPDVDQIKEPLLEVNLTDRSHRHLRPDFNDDIYFDPFNLGDDDYDVFDSDESLNDEDLQVLLNLLVV